MPLLRRLLRTLIPTLASALLLSLPACTPREGADGQAGDMADTVALASPPFVPPETAAGKVLAAAMAEAGATDRLLFVHSGADW